MKIHDVLGKMDISDRSSSRFQEIFSLITYIFLYGPVAVVVALSFTAGNAPVFPMNGVSLRWYNVLVPPEPYNPALFRAFFESVQLGFITAITSTVLALGVSLAIVRNSFENKLLSENNLRLLFTLPIIVPWLVTAVAVLLLFNILNITDTYISLVFGHVLITLPFSVLVISSSLYGFDRSTEEVSLTLGATRLRTFFEVTLPQIIPGVIASLLFAFTISFDNFTQTFFWAGSTITLPIEIYAEINHGAGLSPSINAISTVIVVLSMTLALIGEKLSERYIT